MHMFPTTRQRQNKRVSRAMYSEVYKRVNVRKSKTRLLTKILYLCFMLETYD
jgi:hypothetical protein